MTILMHLLDLERTVACVIVLFMASVKREELEVVSVIAINCG